jgi:endonuclease/exonuclease/phosphatase family metal-dependent hydrolase
LRDQQADVVCLQEDLDDHGEVEGRLYKQFKDVWANKVDGKTVLHSFGEQKNSIMTRFPVVFEDCVDISLPDRQPRCMVRADIRYTPYPDVVTILCTHFGLSRKERRVQALKVAHYIASKVPKHQPLLLVGDFNDWIRRLTSIFSGIGLQDAFVHSRGRHIPTYPAILPLLSLDRVYFTGLDLISSRVIKEAGWYGNSDHLPVVATFRPAEQRSRSTLEHHPEPRL